jgi:hypothetical protein
MQNMVQKASQKAKSRLTASGRRAALAVLTDAQLLARIRAAIAGSGAARKPRTRKEGR